MIIHFLMMTIVESKRRNKFSICYLSSEYPLFRIFPLIIVNFNHFFIQPGPGMYHYNLNLLIVPGYLKIQLLLKTSKC